MEHENIVTLEKVISKKYCNMAGIVVLKDGKTVYEKYFNNCTKTSRIHIYSVTKSILSLLIGIAIDKGYIKDVHQKVLDFFPTYTIKEKETTIQTITIKDLLTMTAPYKYRFAPYIKYFTSDDWVTFCLDLLGGKKPAGKFRYTPLIGPDILSGILVNATGKSVLDFANENVFIPLGITVEKSIYFKTKKEQMDFNKSTTTSGWVCDLQGVNTAGWGLTLSTNDMAKIGQLYLENGSFHGQQIVSSKWIKESTTVHSYWKKQNLSYGYLWWIENGIGFMAMGDGGNCIYVNASKNIVVAINSIYKQRAKDRISFIQQYIEPLFTDSL